MPRQVPRSQINRAVVNVHLLEILSETMAIIRLKRNIFFFTREIIFNLVYAEGNKIAVHLQKNLLL